jgi:hypothetical protein
MKNMTWMAAALAIAALAGCGGKVIVDGFQRGEGGAGGQGTGDSGGQGSGDSGGQGSGPSGVVCGFAGDVATLKVCGTLGSSGPGGPTICGTSFCALNGDVLDSICRENFCACLVNDVIECNCEFDGPGEFCGATPPCCPWEN